MKNFILSMLVFSFIFAPLNASVYKGQKYFKKKCLSCHGKALIFVTEKSYDQWTKYLDVNGDVLYDLHKDVDAASRSMKYFNSQKYRDSVHHFKDFFLEYANDTGNIPACE